jgi:hypothetical protein
MYMNRRKTTGLAAAVFAAIGLFATDAAAQAPTLSATAVADTVTIAWSSLVGATGYNLTVTGSLEASVNLPASVTQIIVKAPAGTYRLRVRGLAGAIEGPLSNEALVTVGGAQPQPCSGAPVAPTLTAATSGLGVTLNWNAVPGAVGYAVQWSRFPGGTELIETTASTSATKYVGMVGTFYARVVTATACGQAVSNEVSFTLENTPGAGPRTPDPAPGQLLPVPDYAEAVVFDMARRYPGQLSRACKNNHEFLYLLLRELRQRDTRWGLNWKRGDRNQGMSSDILAFNPTNGPDEGNGQVYIFDVIGAECERNYPTFINQTSVTWSARGNPACGAGTYCTMWTLQPYLAAGGVPDSREQQ